MVRKPVFTIVLIILSMILVVQTIIIVNPFVIHE